MKFYVIGINDNPSPQFTDEVLSVIRSGKVFSGGIRHHGIVEGFLPSHTQWIDITVPLEHVFQQYLEHPEIVVFASGDPLFYGFANTIQNKLPDADIILFPAFNSLQMLAHRMVLPYHDMQIVSLTGRPWDALDEALIEGKRKIGILTDREKTPAAIAVRMLHYGYTNYQITVGELLGNNTESIRTFSVDELINETFRFPNCLIMERTGLRSRPFGINEEDFHLLNGRKKMITKMPVRLLTLSMLNLRHRHVFWDIGFCTGSVSIEAKMQFPHLKIIAFEQREEGKELMEVNSRKFGTPGITSIIGNFMEADLSDLPVPDAVFIGGHGGEMHSILKKVSRFLSPDGIIVFNAVSSDSETLFIEGIKHAEMEATGKTSITIDNYNTIHVLAARFKTTDNHSIILSL